MSLEKAITDARNEFEEILNFVIKPGDLQLANIEKGIFQRLLKLGLSLLIIFIRGCISKAIPSHYIDKAGVKRIHHSNKARIYLSAFGKVEIIRPYYWLKGYGGVCPLDAEWNLPNCEYSYLLQEWGACLSAEQPYNKAANFIQKFLGIKFWDSSLEEVVLNSCKDIKEFYAERPPQAEDLTSEVLVATVDCKGILMRKSELEIKEPKKARSNFRRLAKLGEKPKKLLEPVYEATKSDQKDGKKKMSVVTAVYTIKRNIRTAEDVLTNHKKEKRKAQPHPEGKIVCGTLESKEVAFKHLKSEVLKKNCKNAKRIALVDGEAKLTELLVEYLPDFEIIRDIIHVKEYLWDAARLFYDEGTQEAEDWVSKQFEMLLRGKVKELINEMEQVKKRLKKRKKAELQRVITYLENGQEYMKYDRYLAEGYQIGSGVIEGTCKNLVNDRFEQSGMHWSKKGANAMLQMRAVHINDLEKDYWQFHIKKEKNRLYGEMHFQRENDQLAA